MILSQMSNVWYIITRFKILNICIFRFNKLNIYIHIFNVHNRVWSSLSTFNIYILYKIIYINIIYIYINFKYMKYIFNTYIKNSTHTYKCWFLLWLAAVNFREVEFETQNPVNDNLYLLIFRKSYFLNHKHSICKKV